LSGRRSTAQPWCLFTASEKAAFACALPDDPDLFAFDPLYGYTELLDENDAPVAAPGASGRIVSTGLLFPGMPFIRYDTGDSAELVALPNATNGYRLTVRGITPKHGTEYLMGRSGTLIAIKGIISNLQGTAYGIREYQFYQDTPGKAVVRLVALSGAVTDFSNYRDLLNRKLAGELQMVVEVVDHIATTPRGKRNSSINASTCRARWPICKELERRCRIPKSRRLQSVPSRPETLATGHQTPNIAYSV
jgi:phenylacetate-CoA ligase